MTSSSGNRRSIAALSCAAVLAVVALPCNAQTGSSESPLLWQASVPEPVLAVSVAANAACVAVRTAFRIHVLGGKGEQSWESPELISAKYPDLGMHAISPQCDWVAVFRPAEDPESYVLQIIGRGGVSTTVPLAAAINVNGPFIRTLDFSADGKLLAIGFDTGYLWVVSRDGKVRMRVGPLEGKGVDAQFDADGKRILLSGWFNNGVMNLDGTWVWKHRSRNLMASDKFDLFAALTAPMHGPQYGDVAILDANGKELWNGSGYDASTAIAPNGAFVAFVSRTEKANQPTQPPFPVVPELNDTPEIWIRDRTGKVLAHGPFPARVAGVSDDGSCILATRDGLSSEPGPPWLAGFNDKLQEVWRIENLNSYPVVTADLLPDHQGKTVRIYRIPTCKGTLR